MKHKVKFKIGDIIQVKKTRRQEVSSHYHTCEIVNIYDKIYRLRGTVGHQIDRTSTLVEDVFEETLRSILIKL
jgi:hypothetical protein